MTEQHTQPDPTPENESESATETPGQLLREGRERLKLSTEQVAERLRLRHQIVLDLEQDLFSKYVASTFTRGYLRAYARLLEIDDERVLRAYDNLGFDQNPTQTMQSFSRRTRQQTQDNRLMLLTYIIIALIIGSAIIFWLQNRDEAPAADSQPSLTEQFLDSQGSDVSLPEESEDVPPITPATSEPVLIDTSLLESDDEVLVERELVATGVDSADAERIESEPAAVSSQSVSEPAPEPVTEQRSEPESASQQQLAAMPEGELVLRFSGDTWIRIEDASGEAVSFGVKSDGHETVLEGGAPYHLTLGAPENVELYYAGERIDLSGYRAGRVARLTLPQTE